MADEHVPVSATHRTRTVLVVDDSAFMRKIIADMISSDPRFFVVGFARNGVEALRQIDVLDPDVVTLDLEMPQLDGMQVLQTVMSTRPRPIVVLSAGGPRFGDATMRALELGAVDFVLKPSGAISLDIATIQGRLLEALEAAVSADPASYSRAVASPSAEQRSPVLDTTPAERVVVIASSTGGPRALAQLIPQLPPTLNAAVLVAQHMPKEFTPSFAQRLDQSSDLRVREARHGEPLLAGHVYIGPGGTNMRVVGKRGSATIELSRAPQGGVSPSADILFMSAATAFRANVIAAVLTGMGRDGAEGVKAVAGLGGIILVQDQASSVIYGMPKAALNASQTAAAIPLSDLGAALAAAVTSMSALRAGIPV